MKRRLYIFYILSITFGFALGQTQDFTKISISLENSTIQNAFETLEKEYNINFSYQSNLKELQKKTNVKAILQPLSKVLDEVLSNSGLSYKYFAGQVVIFPAKALVSGKILIEGKLHKSGTEEPVPFAGLELKNVRKGTISDLKGYFRMELDGKHINDTILVRSLNFNPIEIPVRNLTFQGTHIFYMAEKRYNLPPVDVIAPKTKFETWGNQKKMPSGSFYLDTHGQQTALFIPNEERKEAILVTVNFYLSKKGNTDAPFRVHVYLADSLSGKPVTDQLQDIVIIKPNLKKGWYSVNLSRYRIKIPNNGIFIAIEGIFPGDYDFWYNNNSESSINNMDSETDDFEEETISYGQQIGYNGGINNTWHYSVDGNWFQLKKKRFNAMIYAEIKHTDTKSAPRFLGLFKKKIKSIDS
jgi:hypothetical protein